MFVVGNKDTFTILLNYHSSKNQRKSEQAHIPQAPTLLENATHIEWQRHTLVMGLLDRKLQLNIGNQIHIFD